MRLVCQVASTRKRVQENENVNVCPQCCELAPCLPPTAETLGRGLGALVDRIVRDAGGEGCVDHNLAGLVRKLLRDVGRGARERGEDRED